MKKGEKEGLNIRPSKWTMTINSGHGNLGTGARLQCSECTEQALEEGQNQVTLGIPDPG